MDGALTAVPAGSLTFVFILAHSKQIGARIILRGEADRPSVYTYPYLGMPSSSAGPCFLLPGLSASLSFPFLTLVQ